jgi:hypothetical protein
MLEMSVKKVTIQKKDLPPLSPNGEYLIRYRVISEDKNRTSHWSPIYTLDATRVWDGTEYVNLIKSVTSTIVVNPTSIVINWGTSNQGPLYDIFARFRVSGTWGSYSYQGSTEKHDYSILQPTNGATEIQVVIQLAGIEKSVNPILTISTATKLLRATISGGSA